MNIRDFIAADEYFSSRKNKSIRPVKVKKSFTFKDYLKFKQELEEFEKLTKKEEKKDDKKKFEGMSIPQQMIAWFFTGMILSAVHFSTLYFLIHR